MEVDPETFESRNVPIHALEKICKQTTLATLGPFIQEILDSEEKTRTQGILLYFNDEEKSIIEGAIYAGQGTDKRMLKIVLDALSSFMEKVGSVEVKEIVKILRSN